MTRSAARSASRHHQALSRRRRARRRHVRRRAGHVPRDLRRERRGQEHARQDARRHSRARRRRDLCSTARACRFASPRDALAAGVAMVHQELAFCDNITVAENLCLGRFPSRVASSIASELRSATRASCSRRSAPTIDPDARCRVTERRRAAAGADRRGCRQRRAASSSSTNRRAARRARGRAAVRTDRAARRRAASRCSTSRTAWPRSSGSATAITVLRDGRHVVDDRPIASSTRRQLVQRMIGRRLEQYFPAHIARRSRGEEVLRVEQALASGPVPGYLIHAARRRSGRPGRAGRRGPLGNRAGASSASIAARDGHDRGRGARPWRSARRATRWRCGIGLVPEDRKRQGLVLSMRSRENITLPTLASSRAGGWIARDDERAVALEYAGRLQLRERALEAGAGDAFGRQSAEGRAGEVARRRQHDPHPRRADARRRRRREGGAACLDRPDWRAPVRRSC